MNKQPANSLTIRDSASRKVIAIVSYGSRSVMFREARGTAATEGNLEWLGISMLANPGCMDAIRASGATAVDVADEYVY